MPTATSAATNLSAVEEFITDRLSANEMTQLAALLRKLLHGTPGGSAIQTRYGPGGTG